MEPGIYIIGELGIRLEDEITDNRKPAQSFYCRQAEKPWRRLFDL